MKVSIITVCYNDLENLKLTLESVRAQNFEDYEHIIIDGNSSDGSQEYLKAQSAENCKIVSEKDHGLYNAMNKGLQRAQGDYLYFLNAGDKFLNSQSLQKASSFLKGDDLVYFDIWLKFADHYVLRRYPDKLRLAFWLTQHLCHQACFFSRRCFELQGNYDESYKIAADCDFFLKIFQDKRLSWKHADWSVAVYDMSGVSSGLDTRDQVLAEIERAQRQYLPRLKRFIYGRRVMFMDWIEGRKNRWARFFLRTFVSPLGKVVEAEDSVVDHYYETLPAEHPTLRVVIVNAQEQRGGAAVACSRLHMGLQRLGVLSTLLVLEKNSNSRTVVKAKTKFGPVKIFEIILSKLDHFLKKSVKNKLEGSLLSPGLTAWTDLAENIERLRPDVVHLNWICEGFTRIENLPKIKRPVIWTMHDMWAFCGSEHVTLSERFKKGYLRNNRPDVESGIDINRWNWFRKKRVYEKLQNFVFVGPSRWMKFCVEQSDLLKGQKSYVVQNGLDVDVFFPRNRGLAREILNLPKDKKILMFGAVDASKDPNKGFQYLVEALYRIEESNLAQNICVIVFGYVDESLLPKFSFPIKTMGYISNASILASVYSCADVMVVPSRIESFGQSASEAMACGVPVVAFDTTGLKDIVDHKVNGYMAKCYDHRDLAQGVFWVLENDIRLRELSVAARAKIEANFTLARMAGAYLDLYLQSIKGAAPKYAEQKLELKSSETEV